ncbi:MAG: glutamate--tRNA ligase [Candidatus Riflebacteria bacterium]|nr:glutamate--tRNA ligase [Candidatus Riflebacteria bacterium]
MSLSTAVRVRFAPSPTGNLHVGGARTALFNWLYARRHGGVFVLRIEDTDAERSKDEYVKAILDGLRWLGIDWDEGPEKDGAFGPYFQTARMPLYKAAVDKLLDGKKLYHCFCTHDTLEAMRAEQLEKKLPVRYDGRCRALDHEEVTRRLRSGEKHVLRLRLSEGENVSWDDLNKGPLSFSSDLLDDLVVVKSDGFPTYNFAVVIDDVGMKITHVIRGEDHISNTPKQILLYRALGETIPQFAHIPMILGPDRSRLSKRHGATSVIDYKEMGFEPEAFRNYLALLGWSPEDNTQEILSREQMFAQFGIERVSSHGAIFNLDKLRWMNAEYIKKMSGETLLDRLTPWLEKIPGFPGTYDRQALCNIVSLFRERIQTFNEITAQAGWFFADPTEFDPKGLEKTGKVPDRAAMARAIGEKFADRNGLTGFSESDIETFLRGHAAATGKKAGDVIGLCRLALTGCTATPGLFELAALLGRDRCSARMMRFAGCFPD